MKPVVIKRGIFFYIFAAAVMFNFPDAATVKKVVHSLPRVGVGTNFGLPQTRYTHTRARSPLWGGPLTLGTTELIIHIVPKTHPLSPHPLSPHPLSPHPLSPHLHNSLQTNTVQFIYLLPSEGG